MLVGEILPIFTHFSLAMIQRFLLIKASMFWSDFRCCLYLNASVNGNASFSVTQIVHLPVIYDFCSTLLDRNKRAMEANE